MSYKLQKPYTEKQRLDFIVKYNHRQGLNVEETEEALFALEPFEKLVNGKVIDNTEEYEREQEQIKREQLNMLSLTKREVFLALYKAKGITPERLRAMITDPEALIEVDYAERFYRGNPLIDSIGALLGFTPEMLDRFFESGEWEELVKVEEVEFPPEEEDKEAQNELLEQHEEEP